MRAARCLSKPRSRSFDGLPLGEAEDCEVAQILASASSGTMLTCPPKELLRPRAAWAEGPNPPSSQPPSSPPPAPPSPQLQDKDRAAASAAAASALLGQPPTPPAIPTRHRAPPPPPIPSQHRAPPPPPAPLPPPPMPPPPMPLLLLTQPPPQPPPQRQLPPQPVEAAEFFGLDVSNEEGLQQQCDKQQQYGRARGVEGVNTPPLAACTDSSLNVKTSASSRTLADLEAGYSSKWLGIISSTDGPQATKLPRIFPVSHPALAHHTTPRERGVRKPTPANTAWTTGSSSTAARVRKRQGSGRPP